MRAAKNNLNELDKIDDELIKKACAKMDIFELRQYARIVGVANAEDYGKSDLIEYILDIENGRKKPAGKNKVDHSQRFYEPAENSATYEELLAENKKLKACLKKLEQIITDSLK